MSEDPIAAATATTDDQAGCGAQGGRRRPRVACLHGGTGNAHIFRTQLKHLIAALGDSVELIFVEGSLISEEVRFDDKGRRNRELMRKHFGDDQVLLEHAVTTYGERGQDGPYYYDRLDEGIGSVERRLASLPAPVDALLGFAQGANMSTLVAARAEKTSEGAAPPFKCLVLLENARPGWPEQKPDLFAAPLSTPALVVGGQPDSEAAAAVARLFAAPAMFHHADGHRPLPKQPEVREQMVEQIRSFIFQHCSSE